MVRLSLRNLVQAIHSQSGAGYTPLHPYQSASDALAELRHVLRQASATSNQLDVQELVELAPEGSDGRVFTKLAEGGSTIRLRWAPRTAIEVSGLVVTINPDFGVVLDGVPYSAQLTKGDFSAAPGLLVLWLLGLQLTGCPGLIADVSRGRLHRLDVKSDLVQAVDELSEGFELLTA